MGLVSNAKTLNVALTTKDTDYQVDLPAGTTRFTVQCSTTAVIRLYHAQGGNPFTIKAAPAPPYMAHKVTGARTFWLQGAADTLTAEIEYWT